MVREWAKEKGEINVISGSVFNKDGDATPDASPRIKRLKPNKFGAAPAIPTHFYKVVLHTADSGELEAIAVLLPHNNKEMTRHEAKDYLNDHIVTIDEIEKMAGLDLPPNVSAEKPPSGKSWRGSWRWICGSRKVGCRRRLMQLASNFQHLSWLIIDNIDLPIVSVR